MFLKLVCVLVCTAFAIVAGNEEQHESTTENSSEEHNMADAFGRYEGITLTFDEKTIDLFDSSMFQFHPNLTSLKISQRVSSLESGIFEWAKTLTQVSLDNNQLTSVPKAALSTLPKLTFLSISNNRLEALADGDDFLNLGHLQKLDLDYNCINVVHPNTFASLRELQRLDLSNNRLTSIEGLILPQENQLEVLDLSYNYVTLLNESIFIPLSALRKLSLAGNLFETLRDNTFAELHALEQLDLSDNFFKTLSPKLFTANNKLMELNLDQNVIETLPVNVFSGLSSLKVLRLDSNRLTALPEETVRDQPQFDFLTLSGNRLASFEPGIIKSYIVELQNNRLPVLNKTFFPTNATWVEMLCLYGNEIVTIEQSVFEGLPKVENIYLDNNRIAELSPMLFHKNYMLEQVTLSHNRLSVLRTNTFSGLPYLHQVDLSYNLLTAIEPAVFHHSSVEYLNLNGNQLKTLDDWSFSGTDLRYLLVDSNKIDSLHLVGSVLDKLLELSVANNHIASWQQFCAVNFTRLTAINLANNSLPSMERGCLDHLLPQENSSSDPDLVAVNFAYNTLSEVPVLAGNIYSLDLSGNNVTDLGDGNKFRLYQQTERLVLRNTSLQMLRPDSFTYLQNLTQLEISSSVLERIDEDTFHTLKLHRLVISNSSLQTLPLLLLKGQTAVYDVSLANNELSYLSSAFFADCHRLATINLSRNRLTTVDRLWFRHLEHLQSIDLEGNLIAQLPPNLLSAQHSLTKLSLAGNALGTVADAAFLATVAISELNLSNNNLKDIDILRRNNFITELDVSGNQLEQLLVRPNYRILIANSNQITSLRWETDTKFDLVNLNLADNLLDLLDPQIFNVQTMKVLNVSENRLNTFPFELVYKLKQLETLIVSRNNIRTLPPTDTVKRFKLGTLDLSENPLEEQPSTFLDAWVVNNLILTVAK